MTHSEIAEFQRLVAGHPGAPGSSRLREVLLTRRPAFAVSPAGAKDVPTNIPDISNHGRASIVDDVPALSAGVGLIVAETGGSEPRKVGTAFRVEGGPRRMLTCRHNLMAMLLPNHQSKSAHPLRIVAEGRARPLPQGEGLWPCRIEFPGGSRRMNPNILWAHPAWDLMIFDLEEAGLGEPADDVLASLPIETDRHWGNEGWTDEIAVLGYPLGPTEQSPAFDPFTEDMGKLYVSPGIRRHSEASSDSAANVDPAEGSGVGSFLAEHNASTYRGHSGSPVIALSTKRVLGVHVQSGISLKDENGELIVGVGNRHVMIAPAMDREDALRHQLTGQGDTNDTRTWSPAVSAVERGMLESGGTLEEKLFDAGGRLFSTVIADMPDPRDAHYQPAFSAVPDRLLPTAAELPQLRTQSGPDCVGHAIATALDISLSRADADKAPEKKAAAPRFPVSSRMIYETARLFDEFADDRLGGSSLRGGLKGLFHSGVCPEAAAPANGKPWFLTRDMAEAAREVRLTAYYRLRENISDIQHAVAKTGAVIVSAHIHEGWRRENANGDIPWPRPRTGQHAFVIVGYDRDGWYVRNSWGKNWSSVKGRQGVALWSYEDWRENMIDAWVLQLAPRTPKAFEVPAWVAEAAKKSDAEHPDNAMSRLPLPRRHSLIGHALQAESDQVIEGGRLGLGLSGLRETALYLRSRRGRTKYRRIAILCHDPFLGSDDVARLSGEVVGPMKRDGIYPINLAYGLDEAETIRLRIAADAARLAQRTKGSGEDESRYLERLVKRSASPLFRTFGLGLEKAVSPGGPLWQILVSLVDEAGPFQNGNGKRELLLVSLGAGSLSADALAGCLTDRYGAGCYRRVDLGSLRRANCKTVQSDISVPLAETIGPNPGLYGFCADWCDLVSWATGRLGHREKSGIFATSAELYVDVIRSLRTRRFAHALDEVDGKAAAAAMSAGEP